VHREQGTNPPNHIGLVHARQNSPCMGSGVVSINLRVSGSIPRVPSKIAIAVTTLLENRSAAFLLEKLSTPMDCGCQDRL
jgi:hypothetical protein